MTASFYEGPNLRLDRKALDHMLNSPRGEVGRYLNKVGRKILVGARRMVGVETGLLKSSLYLQHARTSRFQYVQVGSNVHYALAHHEGVRPHVIVPTHGRLLRFNVGGRVVYARKVHNPGYRGRKYLTIPLRRAVR